MHHPKVPVARNRAYEIAFEQFGAYTFVHADVKAWSPSARFDFARDMDDLIGLHGGPLFALVPLHNKKLRKFAAMFGFEHAMPVTTKDGVESEILVRKQ